MLRALFASSMFVRVFATTAAAIALLFVVMYTLAVPFIQDTVHGIEERSGRTILDNVHEMVEQIHVDLGNYRESVILERKGLLRNIIDVVAARARALDQRVRAGDLSRAAARNTLLAEMREIKYGRNDYVFASTYDSVLIGHPDPRLNGADFSARRDARENLIVPPMVEGARARGEGYYSYWWRRLGETEPTEKLSYYRHLPEFELVIGTGVYLDDVDEAVRRKRDLAIDELRTRLRNIPVARTGYLFVFDGRMDMIIHPNPNIEGTNFRDLLDPGTGKPLAPLLVAAADRPEGVRYMWDSPSDPGRYVYNKISWVRHASAFDWYIGSSVYIDELDESARALRGRLIGVFALALLLALALTYLFVKRLVEPLRRLRDAALRVESGDLDTRCQQDSGDEVGVVAAAFNGMVLRLRDNIRHLDAKVAERTSALAKAYDELKELDNLKSEFLSTVSHELRTPMTSIVGFAKLIRKKLDTTIFPLASGDEKAARAIDQVRGNLDIIVAESERLALLINDVLDSAKLEAGKVEWARAPVSPARLIERSAAAVAAQAEHKGLPVRIDLRPDLPDVLADENRLIQVLINLIANAIKFTETGHVELRAERREDFVLFSVGDTGVGIAREHWDAIFDTFRQVGDTLTDKPQGTGLGLSICRQIVTHHGGAIWLESEPGAGSTFFFTVPTAPRVIEHTHPTTHHRNPE